MVSLEVREKRGVSIVMSCLHEKAEPLGTKKAPSLTRKGAWLLCETEVWLTSGSFRRHRRRGVHHRRRRHRLGELVRVLR